MPYDEREERQQPRLAEQQSNGNGYVAGQPCAEPPLLRRVTVFAAASAEELADLCAVARQYALARGQSLLVPAVPGGVLLALADGNIQVYRVAPAGRTITLHTLRPGDSCDLTTHGSAPSYAEALQDDAVIFLVPSAAVRQLAARNARVALCLLGQARRHLGTAHDRLEEMALYSTVTRLARTLLRLAPPDGQPQIRLTHLHLAGLIGASREDVTKGVQHLRALGLITARPHHPGLVIRDPDGLRRFAHVKASSTPH